MNATTTAPTASPDRDYLAATMDALRRLEDASRSRGDLERDLEHATQRRRTFISVIVALIIPVIVWVYFIVKESTISRDLGEELHLLTVRSMGLIGATILLFFVVYILCNRLWSSSLTAGLRAVVERPVRTDYLRRRDALDARSEAILAEPVFADPRIPAALVHPYTVALLLRFFDSGQATFLDAALYMLRQEMANTAYYRQIVPAKTPAERERERIAANRRGEPDNG